MATFSAESGGARHISALLIRNALRAHGQGRRGIPLSGVAAIHLR